MLTQRSRYALRSMFFLATRPAASPPTPMTRIAAEANVPRKFLELILADLRDAGLLHSHRGKMGGYVLSRSMDEISVRDVLVSVGENINPARDLVGSGDIKSDTVEFLLTKTYFENLGLIMQEYLTTTSVGDLIRKVRGTQELPRGAGKTLDVDFQTPGAGISVNVGKTRDLS